MKQFYRPILANAWNISRSNLFLWPLSLFAFFVGIAGTFQVLLDLILMETQSVSIVAVVESDIIVNFLLAWSQIFDTIPWGSLTVANAPDIAFFLLLLFIVIGFTIITLSSEGGLIYAIAHIQNKPKPTYLSSFRKGFDNFPLLFIIHMIYVLTYIFVFGLLIVPVIQFALFNPSLGTFMISLLVYFLLVPTLVILNLVRRYSVLYIMRDATANEKLMPALRNAILDAWLLLRTNWIISLETAALILVALIVFVVIAIGALQAAVVLIGFFGSLLAISEVALLMAIALLAIVTLTLAVFIWSFFTAFQTAIWVMVFGKLTGRERHSSKLHRLTRFLPGLQNKFN